MADDIPYYDTDTCRFVNQDEGYLITLRDVIRWGTVSLLLTCITFGSIIYLFGTPSELWLTAQNKRLADQLFDIQSRIYQYAGQVDSLSNRDRKLYRTLLQARRIPDHALQMGIGGALPPTSYDLPDGNRDLLVTNTAQAADSVARKIVLQRESYRHLLELVDQFERRLPQEPAILPANGPVISGYGMRYHPIYGRPRMHRGIDIRTETGTPVYATGAGRIVSAGRDGGYGLCVRIEHPATDRETRYAHLSAIPDTLRAGGSVRRGDIIGYSGSTGLSTGPHLHYEVRDADGESLNPVHFFVPEMTPNNYNNNHTSTAYAAAAIDSIAG